MRFAPHSIMFEARITAEEGQKKKKKKNTIENDGDSDVRCTVTGWLPSYSPGIEYRLLLDEKNLILTRLGWRRKIWWMTDSFLEQTIGFKETWKHVELKCILKHFENSPMTSESQLYTLNDVGMFKSLLHRHFCPEIWFDLSCIFEAEKNKFSPYVMERRFEEICAWQSDINDNLITAFFKKEHPVPSMSWQDIKHVICSMKKRREEGILGENDIHTMNTVERLQKPDDFSKMMKLKPVLPKEVNLVKPAQASHDFTIKQSVYENMYSLLERVKTAVSFYGSSTLRVKVSDPEVEREIRENRVLIDIGDSEWTTPECYDYFGEKHSFLIHTYI